MKYHKYCFRCGGLLYWEQIESKYAEDTGNIKCVEQLKCPGVIWHSVYSCRHPYVDLGGKLWSITRAKNIKLKENYYGL